MIFLQILLLTFAFFMVYVVRIQYQKKNVQGLEYGLWVAIWLIFGVVVLRPSMILGVAQHLQIARVFDLLVIVALMIVTLLTFHNRVMYRQLQKKLEQVVRTRAHEVAGKMSAK